MSHKNRKNQSFMLFFKTLAFFIFVVISAIVVVPLGLIWLANGLLAFIIGSFRFLGLIPIAIGAVFMLNMFVYFAVIGKGTPAPFDPPKKLVTQGLFGYVRNPGYLGAVLILSGEGIFLQDAVIFIFAAFMSIMFHLFVVYYEEPNLRKEFGEAYEAYLKTVPRWVPRLQKKTNDQKE